MRLGRSSWMLSCLAMGGSLFFSFSRIGMEGISDSDLSPMKKLGMSERELSTESSKDTLCTYFWGCFLPAALPLANRSYAYDIYNQIIFNAHTVTRGERCLIEYYISPPCGRSSLRVICWSGCGLYWGLIVVSWPRGRNGCRRPIFCLSSPRIF